MLDRIPLTSLGKPDREHLRAVVVATEVKQRVPEPLQLSTEECQP
ncbi:hypothetical protein GCM10020218_000950 [Dactylosporangium vinaceum]